MPDYIWIGPGLSVTEAQENTITLDRYGVVSAVMSWTTNFDTAVQYALARNTHPIYGWLYRSSAQVTREEANLGRVRVEYKGIPPEYAQQSQKTYSVEGCLSTEPIETHPDFVTFAGNSNASSKNGAVFDDDGVFLNFSGKDQNNDVSRRKTGVRSYLCPSLILTEVIVKPYKTISGYSPATPSSMTGLGCIVDPPANPVMPTVHSTRTWMLSGVTVEDLGNGTQETRRWRLSGPRGWDPDIYKASAINK
jgi:hypothetical protein